MFDRLPVFGLVNAFSENSSDTQRERFAEELMKILEELQNTAFDKGKDDIQLAKINSCAIALWNASVAMKNGRKTNITVNAQARHVACQLTFLASASEMTESSWRRKLPLALKTGKAWLDCKNPKMAEDSFKLATECWAKIQLIRDSKLTSSQPNMKDELQMQECELTVLKLYTYRAEVAFAVGDDESSKEFMRKAKSMLDKFPKQRSLLATFCYNFGVESFQKGSYEKSISWLRESYEIGKSSDSEAPTNSSKMQATCLRLIAKAYLEIGSEENITLALNSVDLSIAEESNPKSLYLKLKITLNANAANDSQKISILEDCIGHPDLNIDLGVQIFKLITQCKSTSLITKALAMLKKRFQKRNETTKLLIEYLEFLLEDNQLQAAKDLISSELTTGIKQLPQSDANAVKKFHVLIWAQAATFFEVDDFEEALRWYTFSLDCFVKNVQEYKDIAKLQRNRASCLLGMKQYMKASETVEDVYALEGDTAQTNFIHFKLCLACADDDKAIGCIEKLSEIALQESDSNLVHGFICLAAQMAFQDGNKKISAFALEKITQQTKEPKQLLTALSEEIKTILTFIKKAYEALKNSSTSDFESEINWFTKIAWNLGLSCQDDYQDMFRYFVLCYELSSLAPDSCNKIQQKTCLMMASAAGIEAAKSITDENERTCILKDSLSYLQKCERIYNEIKETHDNTLKDKEDPTAGILICLEFEVKALLGYSNLDSVLDKAGRLPHKNPKVLETMAASVLGFSQKYKAVGKRALKMAVKLHLDNNDTDYLQLSKDVHTLVNASIHEGGSSNAQSKEEAFQYYQNILDILQKAPNNAYPEMETLWLMTKAWNCGVYLFSAHEFEACERWCGVAMKLLDRLDSLKSNYSSHMTAVFADMLERREQISIRNQTEE